MHWIGGDSLSSEGVQVVAHIAVRARSALHTLAEDTVDRLSTGRSGLEEVDGFPRGRRHRGEEEQHHAGEAKEESWDSLRSRQLHSLALQCRGGKAFNGSDPDPLPAVPQQAATIREITLTGDAMVTDYVSIC